MDESAASRWTAGETAAFRWFVLYAALWVLPLGLLLGDFGIPWIGEHVLGIDEPIRSTFNGSGDTLYNYVSLFVAASLAVVGGAAWSMLGRRRVDYSRALAWLQVIMRLYLAFALIGYGFAKVFKTQFPFPSIDRLLEPYGESSPMGLAWTFMGYSTAYNVFAGLAEVAGALLLLSRRTSTLGALVVVGVMSNVVMMNFGYDIPVKLLSLHLLAFAVFVAALDRRRLLAFFVRNEVAPPRSLPRVFETPRRHAIGQIGKGLFAAFLVLAEGLSYLLGSDAYPKPELYGLWEVETFERDGQSVPALVTDASRWRRLVINEYGFASVHAMTGERRPHSVEVDPEAGTLTLGTRDEPAKATFTYARPADDELVLEGTYEGEPIEVHFRARDPRAFPLVQRGFHWVNEIPFNQ